MKTNLALLLISGLVFTTCTSISLSAVEEETPTNSSETTYQYPQDYAQNYLQDCIQTAMQEGLVEEDAKTLCNCTLDNFQQQYSLSEFKQLTAASKTDNNASDALIEVGELCLETILFE